jgi:hypothetical protein
MNIHDLTTPIYEANQWYHGTPELQKLGAEFEGRMLSVDYISDPKKWLALQDKLHEYKSGSPEYMDLLHAARELRVHKKVRSPIFLSSQHAIANTYADDRRAFDYQNAEPGVVSVSVAPGKTLTINGQGQSFRGISIDSVKSGLKDAGIDDATIEYSLLQFINDIRGNGDGSRISTTNLSAIVDDLGFDIIDVVRIKDAYNGGGPPATVRMVMNPSLITIHR